MPLASDGLNYSGGGGEEGGGGGAKSLRPATDPKYGNLIWAAVIRDYP